MKAIQRWEYRKPLFYKGGWRWGNPTRMQFELVGNSSQLKDLFSPYLILRVIVVRQEVIENVDSIKSKWKQLSLLKYFFPVFQYERLQTQQHTKILISKALLGILRHVIVCNLEDSGNKPSRLWNKHPCSYFRCEKMEYQKETVEF